MSDTDLNVNITATTDGLFAGMEQAVTAVDSGAQEMDASLQEFQASAARATSSMDAMTASTSAFLANAAVVQDFMATQAQSLDDVTERRAAYNEALAAGIIYEDEYKTASAALSTQEAALVAQSDKAVASAEALAQKYISGSSAAQKLAADEIVLNDALKAGAISAETHAAALAAIGTKQAVLTEEAAATEVAAGAMGNLTLATAGTTREIGVLTGEAMRGNYTRMEGSIVTLGNRMGILQALLNPIGVGFLAIAAGIGVAIYEAIQADKSFNALADSLIATHNNAGMTTEGLVQLRTEVQAVGVSSADAQTDVLALSNSGKVAGVVFQEAALGAAAFAEVTGDKIAAAAKEFEKLAGDPTKAVVELNSSMHLLDASTVLLIADTEQSSGKYAAAAIAIEAVSTAAQAAAAEKKKLETDSGFWAEYTSTVNAAASAEGGIVDQIGNEKRAADAAAISERQLNAARNIVSNAVTDQIDHLIESLLKEKAADDQVTATYGLGKTALAEYTIEKAKAAVYSIALAAADNLFKTEIKDGIDVFHAAYDAYSAFNSALDNGLPVVEKLSSGLLASAKAADAHIASMKKAKDTTAQYTAEAQKLSDLMDQIASGMGGPYLQAITQYQKGEDLLNKTWEEGIKIGLDRHTLALQMQADEDQLELRYVQQIETIKQQHDVMQQANVDLQNQIVIMGTMPQAQAAVTAGLKEYDTLMKSHFDFYGNYIADATKLKAALDAQLPGYIAVKQALNDLTTEQKLNEKAMQEWASIAQNAFDSAFTAINKDIIAGGSVMKDLVSVAQQVVEAILLEFEKLAIINPLLNSIFGGSAGFSILPTLANSALGSLLTGGGLAQSGAIAGGGSYTLANVGGGSSGGLNTFGIGGLLNSGLDKLTGTSGGMFGFGSGIDVGSVLGVLGSIFAGVNEFKSAGGGAAGLAGGASYGAATYLGGSALAAGGGALLAGGGLGGALSAAQGALGALGPVGWAALGLSLLNVVSGGNVFGTSWAPTGISGENIDVTGSGATLSGYEEEKKKEALWGGNKYKDVSVDPSQTAVDSINHMYASLNSTLQQGATLLGDSAATLISGSFAEKFNKDGSVASSLSTILGQTWTDTIQQFGERDLADSLLALLPNAGAIAAQWQSNADTLLAGTQMLVQAQADINKGMGLLGSDSSLADIAAVTQKLAASGETLLQTYSRLQTEQLDLSATLSELGLSTGKTGAEFVTFADQLTQAAGGISNLNAAWATYYSEFYSAGEQAANTLAGLKQSVATSFAAIGESTTVSLAQFRADFTANFPMLTPDQVLEWLAAGDALAKLTTATNSAETAYNNFVIQFDPVAQAAAAATAALSSLGNAMATNLDQANALAQAMGLQGASTQDVANIIKTTLAAFEAQTQQLATQLFGTTVQQLQAKLTSLQDQQTALGENGALYDYYQQQINATQAQIDAANKQAAAAQTLGEASTLLTDLAQIGALSGSSLDQLATKEGIPLDQMAADLGITKDQLEQQFTAAEAQVTAALQTNSYLSQILAVLEGKAIAPIIGINPVGNPVGGLQTMTESTGQQIVTHLGAINDRLELLNNTSSTGFTSVASTNTSIATAIKVNAAMQPRQVAYR